MPEFKRAATVGDIPEGSGVAVALGKTEVALFHLQGQYYAIENTCPHRGGSLGAGKLEGELVTCPMHNWKFNVKTGRLPMGPGVATFPVRVVGDEVQVRV